METSLALPDRLLSWLLSVEVYLTSQGRELVAEEPVRLLQRRALWTAWELFPRICHVSLAVDARCVEEPHTRKVRFCTCTSDTAVRVSSDV